MHANPSATTMTAARDTSRDGLANKLEFALLTSAGPVWRIVQRIGFLERPLNRILINSGIKKAPVRPYRLSTRDDYTSWDSLTDKTFNSRQLPPEPAKRTEPAPEKVAALFRRPSNGAGEDIALCDKSTVLFAYVAQWFTDGFLRSRRATPYRDIHHNESTHEVDLTQLYGLNHAQTKVLRALRGGLLKSQTINGEEFPDFICDQRGQIKPEYRKALPNPVGFDNEKLTPEQKSRLFAMGSDAGNSQIGYAMLNVLFLREHNRIARKLAEQHADWNDDRLFGTARNILVVLLIKLVIEEYINHITPYHFQFRLHPKGFSDQPWMRPNWTAVEFNLLYRWHSLIPAQFDIGEKKPVSIYETLNNTELLTRRGIGPLFDAASKQRAGRVGLLNTGAFFHELTTIPSIEQSRSVRLAPYNDYREDCSYPRVTSFDQITADQRIRDGLRELYGSVDEIEFYIGLFAEDTRPNSVLPPVLGRLVGLHAFSQLMTNPLLGEQVYCKETFTPWGLALIEDTASLSELVHRNLPPGSPTYEVRLTRRRWKRT